MRQLAKRRRVVLTAAGLVASLAVAGCTTASDSGNEPGGNDSSFTLTFGALAAQTGDAAGFSSNITKAATLGVNYAQQALTKAGAGMKLDIFTEDSQSDPKTAVAAATKLVTVNGANVLIGPSSTAETIPVMLSVGVPNSIPEVTLATSPAISEVQDNGLLYRTIASDAYQALALAELMQKRFGANATVNAGSRNDAAGTSFMAVFTKAWEAGGGTIGKTVRWDPAAVDFDTAAQQLASGDPDGWVINDYAETWAKFEPALVRTGEWDPSRTYGGSALAQGLPLATAKKAVGMRGVLTALPTDIDPAAFDSLWNKDVGGPYVYAERETFDAVLLFVLSALKTGSTDGAEIAKNFPEGGGPTGTKIGWEDFDDAIEAVLNGQKVNYQGASGEFEFDPNGDRVHAFYSIWEYQADGTLKTVGHITPSGQ